MRKSGIKLDKQKQKTMRKHKKKKNVQPEMSWTEAVLAYQINMKEKGLEDVRYELKILEDENQRLKEWGKLLQEEQLFLVDDLVKAARETEWSEAVVTKDIVIIQMKSNWTTRFRDAQALKELGDLLAKKKDQILQQRSHVEYWKQYRIQGQHDHEKQIHLLRENIADMEETFQTMSGHMSRSLSYEKQEIEKSTNEVLDQHKYNAVEKAIGKMDKHSRREVVDNDWLSHEIGVHRKETQELLQVVEKLEKENLFLLSQFFNCKIEDLRISRSFFTTQFLGADDLLDKNSTLDIDMDNLRITAKLHNLHSYYTGQDTFVNTQLKSAGENAIEDNAFSLKGSVCDEEDGDVKADIRNFEGSDEDWTCFLANINLGNSEDCLSLGPLELKLLNVTGEKINVHTPSVASYQELRTKLFQPDDWPVTKLMLTGALGLPPHPNRKRSSVSPK